MTKIDPGIQSSPTSLRLLSIVFIAFGIFVLYLAKSALATHTDIALLSHTRAINGYEGLFIGVLGLLVGIGGLWAVARTGRSRGESRR